MDKHSERVRDLAAPGEWLADLGKDLEDAAWNPDDWDSDLTALRLLAAHRLGDTPALRRRVSNRISATQDCLEELRDIEKLLDP